MSALPQLHTPEDVAKALGCSEWWVKEQARRRRVPFTRAGGAYRFTAEHFAEILRIFEERPEQGEQRAKGGTVRRRTQVQDTQPVVQLRARPPRRARNAAT